MDSLSNEAILVVEDSKADYIKIERSFKKANFTDPLIHIEHGDDALDYLLRSGSYANDPKWVSPAIVLLDINLPGADGIQILQKTRATDSIRQIPIIMMTTSSDPKDVEQCYLAGANSYIVKPFSNQDFYATMEKIRNYWMSLVTLPPSHS